MGIPNNYRNRYKADKHYRGIYARETETFFAQDLNELQSMTEHKIRELGSATFNPGEIIEGAEITLNPATGQTTIKTGKVFIDGLVIKIDASEFETPVQGELSLGVVIDRRTIVGGVTGAVGEDPDLIFDDPTLADVAGQDLSPRLQERPRWGHSDEVLEKNADLEQIFFPVWSVRDGVILDTSKPVEESARNRELERYDDEANGSYVARGLQVHYLGRFSEKAVYSVAEGTANVRGRKIDRETAIRLAFADDPDTQSIQTEPKRFNSNGTGRVTVELNRTPIRSIDAVWIRKKKTVQIIRGQVAGGRDPLPDSQIVQVTEVKRGGTSYAENNDWLLQGDELDWRLSGDEPSTGDTLTVTYIYRTKVEPLEFDERTVTVEGAVENSEFDVDYTWMMPRIDTLVLTRKGEIERIKGISAAYNPAPRSVPNTVLELAQITNEWWSGQPPKLTNTAIQAVSFEERQRQANAIEVIFDELARLRLETEVTRDKPASTNGIFVDTLLGDGQRDLGVDQTAAIIAGELTLPVRGTPLDDLLNDNPVFLDYQLKTFASQPYRTGSMKVNPYAALEPFPPSAVCIPAVDNWSDTKTQWLSDETKRFRRVNGSGNVWKRRTDVRERVNEVDVTVEEAQFLRERNVEIQMERFGGGEEIKQILFDGVDVTPTPRPVAGGDGRCSTAIRIPPNIPAGVKRVEVLGAGGLKAITRFVGKGTITTVVNQREVTITTTEWRSDPLAHSFTPSRGFLFGALKVRFTKVGNRSNPIVLQLRTMENGIPTGKVLAESFLDMSGVREGDLTRIAFDNPPWCAEGRELCWCLLTADNDHAIAIAELGKFDPYKQVHITRQANQAGVLFSSSNGSTWTAHQKLDPEFYIEEAAYDEFVKRVKIGDFDGDGTTDLIVLADAESPVSETSVELVFSGPNGELIAVPLNTPLNFDKELKGQYKIEAILKGGQAASPVLFPNGQVVKGQLEKTADYVSRTFEAGAGKPLEIDFEANLPGGSSVKVEAINSAGDWVECPKTSHRSLSQGWYTYTHKLNGQTGATSKLRFTLTGSASARPRVKGIRAVSLKL